MSVSNDTVATAYDLGAHGVNEVITYTFEAPPWDLDSDEAALFGSPPLGVCWVKMTLTEAVWIAFQLPWFAGSTQDSANHGNFTIEAYLPATTPMSPADLAGSDNGGGFGLSGGTPAPYIWGAALPAGDWYFAVAYYDTATLDAITAGEMLKLVITTVPNRGPHMSIDITPATSTTPTFFEVHIIDPLPGEDPLSIGLYTGSLDYGDGFTNPSITTEHLYNHSYSPNDIPSPAVTVVVTMFDVLAGMTSTLSIVYPTPILIALPDVAYVAEVRTEARLVPGIRMDGG